MQIKNTTAKDIFVYIAPPEGENFRRVEVQSQSDKDVTVEQGVLIVTVSRGEQKDSYMSFIIPSDDTVTISESGAQSDARGRVYILDKPAVPPLIKDDQSRVDDTTPHREGDELLISSESLGAIFEKSVQFAFEWRYVIALVICIILIFKYL